MAIFSMVLSLLSGVALFFFGMSLMGDGLKLVAGNKLEAFLYRMTNTPLKGVALGTCVTSVIQSSSATNSHGYRFCKLRYDETETGDRYHHGLPHRNQYYRMDSLSFLYSGIRRDRKYLSTATISAVVAVIGIILRMFCKRSVHKNIGNIMLGFLSL